MRSRLSIGPPMLNSGPVSVSSPLRSSTWPSTKTISPTCSAWTAVAAQAMRIRGSSAFFILVSPRGRARFSIVPPGASFASPRPRGPPTLTRGIEAHTIGVISFTETPLTTNVALVGCGTVGAATAALLVREQGVLASRTSRRIELKRIVDLDFANARANGLPESLYSSDYQKVLADPAIHVVVELVGGLTAAQGHHRAGSQGRQARRHRQQGAARPSRQRAALPGARARE